MATDDFRPGQLRGGWNQLARDLDRAFAIGLFNSLQMLVIEQARELSFTEAKVKGSMEPFPFRLNISDLARIAGCDRSALSRAFTGLVKCRVFFTYKDNLYLINKDYRLWLSSEGKPRLTNEQVAWCRTVIRDEAEIDDSVDLPVVFQSQCTDVSVTEKLQTVVFQSHEQMSSVTEKLQDCDQKTTVGVPPIPPVLERRDNTHTLLADTQSFTIPSTPQRSPEDSALVHEAAALLGADPRTTHLQCELLRNENLTDCLPIAGWQWKLAAETFLGSSVTDRQRRSFRYLRGIAARLTEDDRHPPVARNGTPPTVAPIPTSVPPPTRAELRRRAKAEGFEAMSRRHLDKEKESNHGD